jgi:hypothetical protein
MVLIDWILERCKKQERKPKDSAVAPIKGFKAVVPPQNTERRKLMEGEEVAGTGGCRSVQHHA